MAGKICKGCGTPFNSSDGRQRYCTSECRRAYLYPKAEPRTCPTCGEGFQPRGSQVYCSPEHRPSQPKKPRVAKDISRVCGCGARWTPAHGGVQTQRCPACREADAQVHIYARHKDWRRAVHSRAGGRCADCGKTEVDAGTPHHAHHVLPRAEGGQNTLINGKLLCVLCHDKAHGGNALGAAIFGANPSDEILDALADRLAERIIQRLAETP